jgi:ecotropic viral integration site 5 protein
MGSCLLSSSFPRSQIEPSDSTNLENSKGAAYRVDEFVQDAFSLKITPFMLDSYAHEYEDLIRIRDAHALEVETLRNSNRTLLTQV